MYAYTNILSTSYPFCLQRLASGSTGQTAVIKSHPGLISTLKKSCFLKPYISVYAYTYILLQNLLLRLFWNTSIGYQVFFALSQYAIRITQYYFLSALSSKLFYLFSTLPATHSTLLYLRSMLPALRIFWRRRGRPFCRLSSVLVILIFGFWICLGFRD